LEPVFGLWGKKGGICQLNNEICCNAPCFDYLNQTTEPRYIYVDSWDQFEQVGLGVILLEITPMFVFIIVFCQHTYLIGYKFGWFYVFHRFFAVYISAWAVWSEKHPDPCCLSADFVCNMCDAGQSKVRLALFQSGETSLICSVIMISAAVCIVAMLRCEKRTIGDLV